MHKSQVECLWMLQVLGMNLWLRWKSTAPAHWQIGARDVSSRTMLYWYTLRHRGEWHSANSVTALCLLSVKECGLNCVFKSEHVFMEEVQPVQSRLYSEKAVYTNHIYPHEERQPFEASYINSVPEMIKASAHQSLTFLPQQQEICLQADD